MSKSVKNLALLVVLMLVLSVVIGCAQPTAEQPATPQVEQEEQEQEEQEEPAEEAPAEPEYPEPGNPQLPIVTEETVITVWNQLTTIQAETLEGSFSNNEYFQELERRTGVRVEFIHPTVAREQEALNVMIAAGDLPDVLNLTFPTVMYPGGLDKAITDRVIIDIAPYIRQYAPNYYALTNRDADTRRMVLTDEGRKGGFFQIIDTVAGPQPPWFGPVLRQDWLDSLGLDLPVTYDDWYNMLIAFRDQKGAIAPMMLNFSGFSAFDFFNAGFGFGQRFYRVGDEVRFGPLQPEFREYLEMMAKWYSEGLIDQDFATRREFASSPDFTTTGRAGAWSDIYVMMNLRAVQSGNPDFKVTGVPSPVRNVGDTLHLRQTNFMVGTMLQAITTAAEDPTTIMRWLDYGFSPEGSLFANYGTEGETFEFNAEGRPQYNEFMYANPDGLGVAQAITKFMRKPTGGFYYDWSREFTPVMPEADRLAPELWSTNNDGAYIMPPHVSLTSDEGTEFAGIMGDVNTFLEEMIIKYILGHQSFDTFDSDFVEQLRNMNIERAIEIQQAAYDRFMAR